jgi:hypothetical protein
VIKKLAKFSGVIFSLTILVTLLLYYFFKVYFFKTLVFHLIVASITGLTYLISGRASFVIEKFRSTQNRSYNSAYRLVFCLIFICSFFLVFSILRKNNFQYDSTEKKAFTLSEQTKTLLNKVSDKIKVRYFIRGSNIVKNDLDILNRYHRFNNSFAYTQHDLDKERPLADSLGINEINSLHLSLFDNPSSSIIVSEGLTEEKITNALTKISRVSKPIIYFSTNHGEGDIEDKLDAGFSLLKDSLISDGFLVEKLDISSVTEIPFLKTVLVMLCPVKNFTELEYKKVEKFLSNGGALVYFNEPRIKININDIFSEKGFILGEDTIVGLEKFTTGKASLGVQPVISKYATHPALKKFEKSIVVSAAVSVKKKASADNITEVAFSDEDTWAETDLRSLYSSEPKAIKEPSDIPGPVPFVAISEEKKINLISKVVLIGDLDFVANVNLFQLFNRDFVLNLINWASGDEEFISIRTETLRKSKRAISESEFSNIFIWVAVILPEIVLMFGLLTLCNKKTE